MAASPPRPVPPAAIWCSVGTVFLALLALVSLWTPWTYVSQDNSFGGSVSLSPNGFSTIPTACFFTCTGGYHSPIAYLLLLVAVVTAFVAGIWLLTREPLLSRAAVVLAFAILLMAVLNEAYLYVATLTITNKLDNTFAIPNIGAILAVLGGAGAVVTALVAAISERRFRARLGLPPR
jgi:hypothetical protein